MGKFLTKSQANLITEQVKAYLASKLNPEPEPEYTTPLSYFTIAGDTITGYNGPDTEIVVPRSYSIQLTPTTNITGGNGVSFKNPNTDAFSDAFYSRIKSYCNRIVISDGNKTIDLSNSDILNVCIDNATFCSYLQSINMNANNLLVKYVEQKSITGSYLIYQLFSSNCNYPISFIDNNDVVYTYNSAGDTSNNVALYDLFNVKTVNICGDTKEQIQLYTQTIIPGNDVTVRKLNNTFNGNTNITSVTLLDNIVDIGQNTFRDCSALNEVNMNNITSIGNSAFYNCDGLTTIILPNTLLSIGNTAFGSCSYLQNLNIPENVNNIGIKIFDQDSRLYNLTVNSNNIKYYDGNSNCIIERGTGVDNGDKIICGCKGSTIISAVTEIGEYAFTRIIPDYISIPGTVKYIDDYAFGSTEPYSTSVSIILNEGIEKIGNKAFQYTRGLTYIEIPSTVIDIGQEAFRQCTGLTRVDIHATSSTTKPTVSSSSCWFWSCSAGLVLHIPYSVTNPSNAYGSGWNYRASSATLTYYNDLDLPPGEFYPITCSITNGTYSGDNYASNINESTITIEADSGYKLPNDVVVSGAQYAYNPITGEITINPTTNNVYINAICPEQGTSETHIISVDITTTTYSDNYITIEYGKGTNSSAVPKYYATAPASMRVYANNVITFNARSGVTIKSIEIVGTASNYSAGKLTVSIGTATKTTSGNNVTFTLDSSSLQLKQTGSGQVRISQMTVVVEA